MFISCGQDEPYRSPKKAYFSCVIGLYFLSFFYEHPVCSMPESCGLCPGIYRVFIKEGQKVNTYCTVKIYLLGASMGFILATTYEHLFIDTKDCIYFT